MRKGQFYVLYVPNTDWLFVGRYLGSDAKEKRTSWVTYPTEFGPSSFYISNHRLRTDYRIIGIL